MPELSPEARAILTSARHHETPSAEVRERGWAELQDRIVQHKARDVLVAGEALPDDDWTPSRSRSRWSSVLFYGQCAAISIGIGLSGILLVVGARAGMGTILSVRRDGAMQAERVIDANSESGVAWTKTPVGRRGSQGTDRVEEPVPSPPAEVEQMVEQPSEEPALPPGPRPPRAKSTAASASIAADVALLRAAKAAQDPERTWALLQEHEQRYPHSSFAIERQVLEVEALCRLGQIERGQALAAAFLQSHPGSAFTSRVRKACP